MSLIIQDLIQGHRECIIIGGGGGGGAGFGQNRHGFDVHCGRGFDVDNMVLMLSKLLRNR